jgi:homogentisate 1,2-dioxygenase
MHNAMSAHGPDRASYDKAVAATLQPQYLDATLAFMFETRYPYIATSEALACASREPDYDAVWRGFAPAILPKGRT